MYIKGVKALLLTLPEVDRKIKLSQTLMASKVHKNLGKIFFGTKFVQRSRLWSFQNITTIFFLENVLKKGSLRAFSTPPLKTSKMPLQWPVVANELRNFKIWPNYSPLLFIQNQQCIFPKIQIFQYTPTNKLKLILFVTHSLNLMFFRYSTHTIVAYHSRMLTFLLYRSTAHAADHYLSLTHIYSKPFFHFSLT